MMKARADSYHDGVAPLDNSCQRKVSAALQEPPQDANKTTMTTTPKSATHASTPGSNEPLPIQTTPVHPRLVVAPVTATPEVSTTTTPNDLVVRTPHSPLHSNLEHQQEQRRALYKGSPSHNTEMHFHSCSPVTSASSAPMIRRRVAAAATATTILQQLDREQRQIREQTALSQAQDMEHAVVDKITRFHLSNDTSRESKSTNKNQVFSSPLVFTSRPSAPFIGPSPLLSSCFSSSPPSQQQHSFVHQQPQGEPASTANNNNTGGALVLSPSNALVLKTPMPYEPQPKRHHKRPLMPRKRQQHHHHRFSTLGARATAECQFVHGPASHCNNHSSLEANTRSAEPKSSSSQTRTCFPSASTLLRPPNNAIASFVFPSPTDRFVLRHPGNKDVDINDFVLDHDDPFVVYEGEGSSSNNDDKEQSSASEQGDYLRQQQQRQPCNESSLQEGNDDSKNDNFARQQQRQDYPTTRQSSYSNTTSSSSTAIAFQRRKQISLKPKRALFSQSSLDSASTSTATAALPTTGDCSVTLSPSFVLSKPTILAGYPPSQSPKKDNQIHALSPNRNNPLLMDKFHHKSRTLVHQNSAKKDEEEGKPIMPSTTRLQPSWKKSKIFSQEASPPPPRLFLHSPSTPSASSAAVAFLQQKRLGC